MINQERDPIERIRKLLLSHDLATEKDLKVSFNFSMMRLCFKFSSKEGKKIVFVSFDHQDIEKEMRKEVDEAIAQAKVRRAIII